MAIQQGVHDIHAQKLCLMMSAFLLSNYFHFMILNSNVKIIIVLK